MSDESGGVASEFPAEPKNKTQDSNTHLFVMTTPFGRADVWGAEYSIVGHARRNNHDPCGP
jgi:hypothetical protein